LSRKAQRTANLFIISAPSGSGKSTLVSLLMAADPCLRFSVSYTTRQPRGLEQDGASYYFVERADFEARLAKGEFLEHAEVFGNYYGTHRSALTDAQAEGKDLLLDIDVQGAAQLKQSVPEAVSIFVLPPNRDILEERLRARSEDAGEVIERRLRDAATEINNYRQYDYVLINQDLEESAADLIAIVRAERARRQRMEERIRPILASFAQAANR
jgi:guanylate kinase